MSLPSPFKRAQSGANNPTAQEAQDLSPEEDPRDKPSGLLARLINQSASPENPPKSTGRG
ncbi:hypothetical protein IscW_ISCW013054 [Ixodes scapularis]|uniref:Uncharacterized protein n=1 Tax=Ixodes scapularis TaxID=6945 RepID=B7QDN2_IXOSC|nr:hypothetical protein IscW_ISCW013054 [Ixodes scapularis]|eukprot:XP_002413646.1 hypothetical protein IscW_ISCW013054 [Ixodes scapularis]